MIWNNPACFFNISARRGCL